jgi:transposase
LMPPSVRDWLPAEHLAWFVLDTVDRLDLDDFYRVYRGDGLGRPAHDPRMMVALLVYAYSVGELSSRQVERRCVEDVAFRVIAANRAPDHTTIARFRARHESALADLFVSVLALCSKAGMVRVGTIAIDGTKMAANAGLGANRRHGKIRAEVERLLGEAAKVDAAEDEQFGERRGDELPAELADPASRRARLERAARELEAEDQERQDAYRKAVERRETHLVRTGRYPPGRPPKAPDPGLLAKSKRNITDPDSRVMSLRGSLVQAYNAQAVVGEGQVILAASVTNSPNDKNELDTMLDRALENLAAIEHPDRIKCVLADGGYWNNARIKAARAQKTVVVVPTGGPREGEEPKGKRRGHQGPEADRINKILATQAGKRLYRRRAGIVEPVFGHTKHQRGIRRFSRRGLQAADNEWKLIAATHNLLKLFRYRPLTT